MKNKIPNHWQKFKFEDVLQYEQPAKYIVKSTEYSDEYEIPVLTAGKSFILGYTDEKDGIFTDIPVIIFDDFTTATKFVDFKFKVKSSAMKILKPSDNANIKFLFYLMQTIYHKSDTHKRYWISEYAKREILLPPLDEQNLIVKKIESCFEKIDFAISKLQKSKELIKIYKQSVLSHAFNGKLTNSNLNSWQIKKLGEISNYGKAKQIKSENLKNTDWILGLEDIEKETGRLIKKVSFESIKSKSNKLIFNKGDILFGTLRPYLKKFLIADDNGYCTTEIMPFTTGNKITNLYVLFYLKSNIVENFISSVVYGTRMPRFGINHGKNLEIPLPPLYEQNLIVLQIEKRFKVADNALNLIEQSLQKAEILKQSILQKAFNGELIKDKNE